MPSTAILSFSLLNIAATLASAQTFDKSSLLNRTIQSCADVQCPSKNTTTTVACTLTNETYTNVGLTEIPNTTGALTGLTWVEAIVGKDLPDNRHFIKDFFLASDPDFIPPGGGSCALFFTKVSSKVKFVEGTLPADVTQGTCAQAMSETCVARMVERAKGVDVKGLEGEEACAKLKTAFENGLDSECSGFAAGTTGWTGVEARVLTGPGASKPITAEQNASSNCWPVQPKGYDLTRVMRVDTTGDGLITTALRELFAITPILTVFFSGANGTAVVGQPEAQLTCLKAIDLNEASLANMSPGVPESGTKASGGWRGSPSLGLAGLVAVVGVVVSLA